MKRSTVTGMLLLVLMATFGFACGSQDGNAVSWSTTRASLEADDFSIVVDGKTFTAQDVDVDAQSDPGDTQNCTLELIWQEQGVEMRLFIYFEADGTNWWSDEVRTYNGKASPDEDWVYYIGTFFQTKLGETFTGDIDLQSTSGGTGTVHFKNLRLQAFL
jgi:hypothetical protein